MTLISRKYVAIISLVVSLIISNNAVSLDSDYRFENMDVGRDWQVENAFLAGILRGGTLGFLPSEKFGDSVEVAHSEDVFVMTEAEHRLTVSHGRHPHIFGVFVGNFLVIFIFLGFLNSLFLRLKI